MKLKVTCTYKEPSPYGHSLHFRPVFAGSAENAAAFNKTPCGSFKLDAMADETASRFAVGQEYSVTFE